VFVGLVNYLDYEREVIRHRPISAPVLTKRISFEHERELGAMVWFLAQMHVPLEQRTSAGWLVRPRQHLTADRGSMLLPPPLIGSRTWSGVWSVTVCQMSRSSIPTCDETLCFNFADVLTKEGIRNVFVSRRRQLSAVMLAGVA
jgi:hypothetical protein